MQCRRACSTSSCTRVVFRPCCLHDPLNLCSCNLSFNSGMCDHVDNGTSCNFHDAPRTTSHLQGSNCGRKAYGMPAVTSECSAAINTMSFHDPLGGACAVHAVRAWTFITIGGASGRRRQGQWQGVLPPGAGAWQLRLWMWGSLRPLQCRPAGPQRAGAEACPPAWRSQRCAHLSMWSMQNNQCCAKQDVATA